MVSPTLVAAFLATLPAVFGQDITTTTVSCQTIVGPVTIDPTFVPTTTRTLTWTQTISNNSTLTIIPTVTTTPNATIFSGVFTSTNTLSSVITITPSPTTVGTPTSFLPFSHTSATPTPASRRLGRRQNPGDPMCPFNNGLQEGFDVVNGALVPICPTYPNAVVCVARAIIIRQAIATVTGATSTITASAAVITAAASTTTITVTSVSTTTLPQSTFYAACGADNVVNQVGNLNIGKVLYIPAINLTRQRVTNASSGYDCCVDCQKTDNCAGSFYHRNTSTCHISLSEAPVNVTVNGTSVIEPFCRRGSGTTYLGQAQPGNITADQALYISNGQCGYWSFNPNTGPVGETSFSLASTSSVQGVGTPAASSSATGTGGLSLVSISGAATSSATALVAYKKRWHV